MEIELLDHPEQMRMRNDFDRYTRVLDAAASLAKVRKHIARTVTKIKKDYLINSIQSLEDDVLPSAVRGTVIVKKNIESMQSAMISTDFFASSMTLPTVSIDNKGNICFEWGSVYSRYLLVRFLSNKTCAFFWQESMYGEVGCKIEHLLSNMDYVLELPYRM